MGQCCCKNDEDKDKDDIPKINVRDLCNDMECVCASSCCVKKQPKKHHNHHHHHHNNKK